MWLMLEWLGTIIALLGSVVMAGKVFSPALGWKMWAMANLLHITLLGFHTHQYGLLSIQVVGLGISLLGWKQWSDSTQVDVRIMNIFASFTVLGLFGSVLLTVHWLFNPSFANLEWIGSALSVSGAFLLASKHKNFKAAWPIWIVGNLILLTFTVHTAQWGLATLQIGFSLINIYGIYSWFIPRSTSIKNLVLA